MRTFQLNKLVRDKIVQLQQAAGNEVDFEELSDTAYVAALVAKLKEEANELTEGDSQGLLDELADLQEVIDALVVALGETREALQEHQADKRQKVGGFEQRRYVHTVTLQDDDQWAEYYASDPIRFPEVKPQKPKA